MARVRVDIEARDKFSASLKRLGRSVKTTLASIGTHLRSAAKWLLAGGIAAGVLGGGFRKLAKEAAADEQALMRLTSALRTAGSSADPKTFAEYASALERLTGIQDDTIVGAQAMMLELGVTSDALDEATRAAVALVHAGWSQEEASTAVANAVQGEYGALTRYLPKLRDATDEAEKAQIVNDYLTGQWNAMTNQTGSLSVSLRKMGTTWSNFWEKIGASLQQRGSFDMILSALSRLLDNVAAAIDRFIANGGVDKMIALVDKLLGVAAKVPSAIQSVGGYIGKVGAVLGIGGGSATATGQPQTQGNTTFDDQLTATTRGVAIAGSDLSGAIKKLERDIADNQPAAELEEFQAKLERANKVLEGLEDTAEQGKVRQSVLRTKERKQIDEVREAEDKRGRRLAKREKQFAGGRGRLSKYDAEFLANWRKIRAAEELAQNAKSNIEAREKAAFDQQTKMLAELQKLNAMNRSLLIMQ